MLISLTRLTDKGLNFEHQYQADELDTSAHEFLLKTLPQVSGRVDKIGVDIRLRGKLNAELIVPCDRCLDDTLIRVVDEFDLFYSPSEYEAGKSGEAEVLERDLDFSVYENEQIDLDEAVLEQLELSLPQRVLCKIDCRGLCAQCGTNLNLEICQCQQETDPRWSALADLKKQMEEDE